MRRVALHGLPLVLFAVTAASVAQTQLENLDFEQGRVGAVPRGWLVPTPDYRAALTDRSPLQGKLCVELASGDEPKSPFGNLMRSVDATPYRGQLVRLRAAVRIVAQGPSDRAQLWFRVDRPGGRMGFFNNMDDRPIRAPEWRYYEITGEVAADAVALNFGLMLITRGKVWLDDVTLEVVGAAATEPADPPRALDERGLENLVAFTRLMGYVRYFHPSDQVRDADWPMLTIAGIRKVEPARDAQDLAHLLANVIGEVAPTVRIFANGQAPPPPPELSRPTAVDDLRVAYWTHSGVGLQQAGGIYRSQRATETLIHGQLPEGAADPGKPFEADLGGGVTCRVPLALWADGQHTLPRVNAEPPQTAPSVAPRYSGDSRTVRLADVAFAWNVFQHFYPYFDVVGVDWYAELRKALSAAATDKDERAFLDTLRTLVAALHDGHGGVYHSSDVSSASLLLAWDWIEDSLVLTAVQSDTGAATQPDLRSGDVIVKIDGRVVPDILADVERRTSAATPQFRRWSALRTMLRGTPGEVVALTVQRGNASAREVKVPRIEWTEPVAPRRPQKIEEVRPGIIYVDMDRVTDADFQAALPQLEKATGIVFDFRGYPSHISPQSFFPYLTKAPLKSAQWHVPVVIRPDRQEVQFQRSGEWNLMPAPPYLAARRAFIIDARAISYAESCLGIVEHYHLGELVGGPTAGTNGNVNPFTLPGGYRISWTGMKVLKQDGSQHHGIGIRPTIPVARTIEGVRAGRDELLEKAITAVSDAPTKNPASGM